MKPGIVFIVDDDAAIRDSLALLFETAGLTVQCFDSGEAFLATAKPDMRGCIVLDQRMVGMTGIEMHAELNRIGVDMPVIYLTGHGDIKMTVKAMKSGAVDFLTKPIEGAVIFERVLQALSDIDDRQGADESARAARRRIEILSPREREIMSLSVAGWSCKLIARKLGISHRTVEIHRSNILRKTGSSNVFELSGLVSASRIDVAPPPSAENIGAPPRSK